MAKPDAAVILDVLAARRELAASDAPTPRLVVELHDADHVALVDLTGPDDFVISDAIGSHVIAQLVDQPRRRDVLRSLYARDGASLRLVPCERFDLSGERIVAEMVKAVAARGLLLIGWRRQDDPDRTVTLNPHLDDRTQLSPGDEIIVIG